MQSNISWYDTEDSFLDDEDLIKESIQHVCFSFQICASKKAQQECSLQLLPALFHVLFGSIRKSPRGKRYPKEGSS